MLFNGSFIILILSVSFFSSFSILLSTPYFYSLFPFLYLSLLFMLLHFHPPFFLLSLPLSLIASFYCPLSWFLSPFIMPPCRQFPNSSLLSPSFLCHYPFPSSFSFIPPSFLYPLSFSLIFLLHSPFPSFRCHYPFPSSSSFIPLSLPSSTHYPFPSSSSFIRFPPPLNYLFFSSLSMIT